MMLETESMFETDSTVFDINNEENSNDYGIKIRKDTDLFEEIYSENEFDDDDDDDDDDLNYGYDDFDTPPSQNNESCTSNRKKRKQEFSFIDRDDSVTVFSPGETIEKESDTTMPNFNSMHYSHLFSRRKDKPPLYLLKPEEFAHDPSKQHQIRRAIITYRHHQEKKELIRKLSDENYKLKCALDKYRKREEAIIEACSCKKSLQIILSCNPERGLAESIPDIVKLPPIPPTKRQIEKNFIELQKQMAEADNQTQAFTFPQRNPHIIVEKTTAKNNGPLIFSSLSSSHDQKNAQIKSQPIFSKPIIKPVNVKHTEFSTNYSAVAENVQEKPKIKNKFSDISQKQRTMNQIQLILEFYQKRSKLYQCSSEMDSATSSDEGSHQSIPGIKPEIESIFNLSSSINKIETVSKIPTPEIPTTEINGQRNSVSDQQKSPQRPQPPVTINKSELNSDTFLPQDAKQHQDMLIKNNLVNHPNTYSTQVANENIKYINPEHPEEKAMYSNQRRSKRTAAIFRPNAVDMLKGIKRKPIPRSQSSSTDSSTAAQPEPEPAEDAHISEDDDDDELIYVPLSTLIKQLL